ncbi:Ogr/Delta-like zinc finger protein [Pseudomonas sp. X10]
MSTYKLVCPHCNSRLRIRTSEGWHIFLRVAYLQCTTEACGWAVRAEFEMTYELSPFPKKTPRLSGVLIFLRGAISRSVATLPAGPAPAEVADRRRGRRRGWR